MRTKAQERMVSIGHALLGIVFVLKGVSKADHWPEHAGFVVLFVAAGVVVFLGTALHARLGSRFPHMEALFFLLEGIVLAAMTWLYFEAGKRWLPWVTGATAVAFAVLAVYRAWHPPAHRNA